MIYASKAEELWVKSCTLDTTASDSPESPAGEWKLHSSYMNVVYSGSDRLDSSSADLTSTPLLTSFYEAGGS